MKGDLYLTDGEIENKKRRNALSKYKGYYPITLPVYNHRKRYT
jgi:hypothetical protein